MNIATGSGDSELQIILDDVYRHSIGNREGALADYIPELAKIEPDNFGLAIATARGHLVTAGDCDVPFTIQSVSKAFSYCLAIELVGREAVLERVGVEPSGDTFNASVVRVLIRASALPPDDQCRCDHRGRDHPRCERLEAFDFVLERLSRAAGYASSISTRRSIARKRQPAIATAPLHISS